MFNKSLLYEDQLDIEEEKDRRNNISLEESLSDINLKYQQGKLFFLSQISIIDSNKANKLTSIIDNQLMSPSLDEFDNDKLIDKFKQEF